MKMRTDP